MAPFAPLRAVRSGRSSNRLNSLPEALSRSRVLRRQHRAALVPESGPMSLDRVVAALRPADRDPAQLRELLERGPASEAAEARPVTPPNGMCGSSWTVAPLTWQIPVSNRRATSKPRGTLRPKTAPDSPHSVSLATRIASYARSTGTTVTTGPKDSSPYRRMEGVTPDSTVGAKRRPSASPRREAWHPGRGRPRRTRRRAGPRPR
jgi:hypothetical protein